MSGPAEARTLRCRVNGAAVEETVEPRLTLADFLRRGLRLTGTHLGCEHGVCGACTVLVDGLAVRSCLMLAVQAEGAEVETVEGLAASGEWAALLEAFHQHHALQCGYCTPGILATLAEVLSENAEPDEEEIRVALSGNLCRCTGYQNIVAAALAAARALRSRRAP